MAVSQQSDATSRLIAALLGPVFVISGLLVLFNPQALPGIIRAFVADPTLVVLAGYMSFVPGLAIVYFHNRWARGWPLLVTLSGWICVVVGAGRIVLAYRLTPLIGAAAPSALPMMPLLALAMLGIGGVLSFQGYRRG